METMSNDWRKSSYSGNGGANCVECATAPQGVAVRDTTQDGTGPVIRLTAADWARFIRSL